MWAVLLANDQSLTALKKGARLFGLIHTAQKCAPLRILPWACLKCLSL